MYSINTVSLFPEMFQTLEERAKASSIRQVFTVIGLIFAYIMPTLFIPQLDNPKYFMENRYAGICTSIFFFVGVVILLKYGVKEREEFSKDYKIAPSFFNSLKYSLKNPAFRVYILVNIIF